MDSIGFASLFWVLGTCSLILLTLQQENPTLFSEQENQDALKAMGNMDGQ